MRTVATGGWKRLICLLGHYWAYCWLPEEQKNIRFCQNCGRRQTIAPGKEAP